MGSAFGACGSFCVGAENNFVSLAPSNDWNAVCVIVCCIMAMLWPDNAFACVCDAADAFATAGRATVVAAAKMDVWMCFIFFALSYL